MLSAYTALKHSHDSAWIIFYFATFLARSHVQLVVLDCWPAVAGISFMLINVRVGLGWAQRSQGTVLPSGGTATIGGTSRPSTVPMQRMTVNISQAVENDEMEYSKKPSGY